MTDTPTPKEVPVLPPTVIGTAAVGVASVGTAPLPFWIDPDHTGVPLYNRKVFRDGIVNLAMMLLGKLAPTNPYVLLVQGYKPQIQALIDQGAK